MIPIYKNTLTRLDLSSVLNYMVENELEGKEVGQILSKEFASLSGYSGACTLRNPFDAINLVLELLEIQSVLLPILAPRVLSSKLESLGIHIQFYDVDPEHLNPLIHKEQLAELKNVLLIEIQYFGARIDRTKQRSPDLEAVPMLEICWSFKKSLYEKKVEARPSSEDSSVQKSSHKNSEALEGADFCVLLLEHNSLCTSGGGAVLLSRDKQHSKKLKLNLQDIESWFAMTDFNAGLALAQFKQAKEFISKIHAIIPYYQDAVQKTKYSTIHSILDKEAIPQCFPVLVHTRVHDLIKFVKKQGIDCMFPFQDSQLAAMLESPQSNKDTILKLYPHAEKLLANIVVFPLYSSLSKDEVQHIVKVISSLP